MSVNLIFSSSNGGVAITDILDHGNASNGNETTAQEIFVRHDGSNSITNVSMYARQISGTYSGSTTAAADFAELLSWGDESTSTTFGGLLVNWNAILAYPAGDWPVYNNKAPTNGFVHRTSVGDAEGTAVSIPTATGATATGEIQAGTSPNVRFKTMVAVPSAEDTIGIRQWETILLYTFTS